MRNRGKDYRVYMQDILSAIVKIETYTEDGKEKFLAEEMVQDAVIRQLMITGEACAKLPVAMRKKYGEIPWKEIIGMRNIIIHDYANVDLQIVWDAIVHGLPNLRTVIATMLKEYS